MAEDQLSEESALELTTEKTADQVLDMIMDYVADGTIQMGDRLNTAKLAKMMGTSRMPVREALSVLVQKRLAYNVKNAGMRMVELSEDEFVEIYRIRQLLEPEAAFLACKNATPEDIANLEQLFAEHEAAVAADPVSPKLVHKCNRAFHFGIYRAAHREHLTGVIGDLWDQMSFAKLLYGEALLSNPENRVALVEEHRYYLDCVKNGWAGDMRAAVYNCIEEKIRKCASHDDSRLKSYF